MGRQSAVTMIVALIASGIWPFFQFLLRREPEARQLDAQTTSITVQGAETTVTVMMKALESEASRNATLEAKLADRDRRIETLERRLEDMSDRLTRVQVELAGARMELAEMKT